MSKNKNKQNQNQKPSYEDAFFAQRSTEKDARRIKMEKKNYKKSRFND